MSMWEIDELLKESITLVQASELTDQKKRNIIWNLESLPEKYEMDAGGFQKTETGDSSLYTELLPYELGELLFTIETDQKNYIYDWSAFLLNFSTEYFKNNLKEGKLSKIKEIYHKNDFIDYEPKHVTLTIYENGNKYFSEEQNELIKWFLN